MGIMKNELLHKEASGEIIRAAMNVLNELKPGLDEKLYENALVIELQGKGHSINQLVHFPVRYKGRLIGTRIPDLIVDGLIIVDPKVVAAFNETHVAQMTGYLAKTGLELALLINFKYAKLQWKRVVRSNEGSV
jgi:GxxExxY protein